MLMVRRNITFLYCQYFSTSAFVAGPIVKLFVLNFCGGYTGLRKGEVVDNSSEYLESSGTKIMMREPIEHQLLKDTNKQRNEINQNFFLVFKVLCTAGLLP